MPWSFLLLAWACSRAVVLAPLAVRAWSGGSARGWLAGFGDELRNWDASWLLEIAAHGYRRLEQTAFFPAFPQLVAAFSPASGASLVAATTINLVGCLVAAVAVHRIAKRRAGEPAARLAVLLVLFHPLSFYLAVPYTESLFLASAALALLFAEEGKIPAAAVCASVATLTRNTGILLVLPLALAVWKPPAGAPWRRPLHVVSVAALPILALAAWSWWLARRFGDPLAFVTAQRHWAEHLRLAIPFRSLFHEMGRWRGWLDHHLPLSLVGLWLAWRLAKSGDRVSLALVAPPMALSFSLSKLAITPRLHLVLFPLWIELARALQGRDRRLAALVLLAAAGLGAALAWQYAGGVWVD